MHIPAGSFGDAPVVASNPRRASVQICPRRWPGFCREAPPAALPSLNGPLWRDLGPPVPLCLPPASYESFLFLASAKTRSKVQHLWCADLGAQHLESVSCFFPEQSCSFSSSVVWESEFQRIPARSDVGSALRRSAGKRHCVRLLAANVWAFQNGQCCIWSTAVEWFQKRTARAVHGTLPHSSFPLCCLWIWTFESTCFSSLKIKKD